MAKDHALKEVQKLFPRQKKVNAIDVFITTHKKPHQRFYFGNDVAYCDPFNLFTPDNYLYSERFFRGSELSLSVCEGYNNKYGLISLIAQMYQLTENRSIGREIVRAFVKHAICITSKHLSEYSDGSIFNRKTMNLQKRDTFYAALFDPKAIISQMRGSKKATTVKHIRQRGGKANISFDSNPSQRDAFVRLCEENSLGTIKPIIDEVLKLDDRIQRESAFKGIGYVFRLFSRPTNKTFYKHLNEVFKAKGSS